MYTGASPLTIVDVVHKIRHPVVSVLLLYILKPVAHHATWFDRHRLINSALIIERHSETLHASHSRHNRKVFFCFVRHRSAIVNLFVEVFVRCQSPLPERSEIPIVPVYVIVRSSPNAELTVCRTSFSCAHGTICARTREVRT
jgi:hypothetical protein